jgi:tetratricopeptide (TPR) repeat protein
MQTRAPRSSILDRTLKFLVLALVVAVVGFAAFYYTDRQVKPGPGLVEQGIAQAEENVRQDPSHAGRRVALATLYAEARRFDEAITQFKAALEIDSASIAANYGLAIVYLERRQFAEAEAELQKVVDSRGDSEFSAADKALQAAYYHLGRAQGAQQKLDAAIPTLERAVTIDRADADSLELLGSAYLAAGKLDLATLALERAVLFVPDSPDAFSMLAHIYRASGNEQKARYAQAMVLYGQRAFDQAAAELLGLLQEQPDDAAAWTGLGFVYEAQDLKREAADAYERALAAKPGDFNARQGFLRVGVGPRG